MKRIALFGGSFNPIHLGHIALAEAALREELSDEVWFMVSPHNPLKKQSELLSEQLRLALVKKALAGSPRCKASDFEFSLPRPSYTYQTLRALQNTYPQYQFSLLIGADNWNTFERWAHWEELLEQYKIIVYPRPNSPITKPLSSGISYLEAQLHDISSTEIRKAILQNKPLSQWLPASIIEDCQIYYGLR